MMAHVELDATGNIVGLYANAQTYTSELADDDPRVIEFIAESERRRSPPPARNS